MKTIYRVAAGLLAVLLASSGLADEAASLQATQDLTGSIKVGADGRVASYQLDHPREIQPVIKQLIAASIAGWHLAPAGAEAQMQLKILASTASAGQMAVRIAAVHFGGPADLHGLAYNQRKLLIGYPARLLRSKLEARLGVLVEIGRDGRVVHADAERVDISEAADEDQMQDWREAFAEAAVRVIKTWTFTVPAQTVNAPQHWYALVPVSFAVHGAAQGSALAAHYGDWDRLYPGPRMVPSWYQPSAGQSLPNVVMKDGLASLQSHLQWLSAAPGS